VQIRCNECARIQIRLDSAQNLIMFGKSNPTKEVTIAAVFTQGQVLTHWPPPPLCGAQMLEVLLPSAHSRLKAYLRLDDHHRLLVSWLAFQCVCAAQLIWWHSSGTP
jgi:hypothetical protein